MSTSIMVAPRGPGMILTITIAVANDYDRPSDVSRREFGVYYPHLQEA